MQFLFIANGISSANGTLGVSGGDVRWIEIAKDWQKQGHKIKVLTPEPGRHLCHELGLDAEFHISTAIADYSLINVFRKTFKAMSIPASLKNFEGTIYTTHEGMDNTIPAARIRAQNSNNIWAATIHWVAPIRRVGTNIANSTLMYINHRIGFRYIKKYADVIFSVSSRTTEKLPAVGLSQKKIFTVGCGVNYNDIVNISNSAKTKEKYDAVFMKRFHGTKGAFDIVDIWKKVVETKCRSKLAMVGGGPKKTTDKIRRMIHRFGMEQNVTLFGPIYDFKEKFSLLAGSKLFVAPSYEENWAIVIGEAMATGLPVICYDLPDIKPVWLDNVVWVPRGDKNGFARRILELLDNKDKREYVSRKGQLFVKKYSWEKIAERELKIITDCERIRPSP
jgi:glycosyltransferase involved in cell wall biosynthesis